MNEDYMFEEEVDKNKEPEKTVNETTPEVRSGYYYNQQPSNTGMAIGSFVSGLLALLFFSVGVNLLVALISIALGIVFLTKTNEIQGRTLAKVGIVVSIISIILFVGSVIWILPNAENLTQMYDSLPYYNGVKY
ncbi:MAG: hypothetical protein K5769_09390 [Pseudobutyrivibrio sp.]|nr:hypothetical protein [Pseudobutyrivibrio sp.]